MVLFKTLIELQTFLASEGRGNLLDITVLHDDGYGCTPSACRCPGPWFEVRPASLEARSRVSAGKSVG